MISLHVCTIQLISIQIGSRGLSKSEILGPGQRLGCIAAIFSGSTRKSNKKLDQSTARNKNKNFGSGLAEPIYLFIFKFILVCLGLSLFKTGQFHCLHVVNSFLLMMISFYAICKSNGFSVPFHNTLCFTKNMVYYRNTENKHSYFI